MLLIALSWIYILFTTINLGFGLDKSIGLHNKNFAVTSILGLFVVTILGSIWAIFGRINIEFHAFLFALNLLLFYTYFNKIKSVYINFFEAIQSLSTSLKIFLLLTVLLAIGQCATAPFIADNESYYIQTIKWLNEYGLVKGLANLHIFFGQMSGWHIAQSVFSFSFLNKNLNDLSGFCLLLGNTFAILKLNSYFTNAKKTYLIFGLLPILNILFFRFISTPSPDIPIYFLSFIVFFYFIENFNKMTIQIFNLITILVLYILFIKTTSIALVLIPIILLIYNWKTLLSKLATISIISFVVLALYISKNYIITGYPIYPLNAFKFSNLDYALPNHIRNFLFDETRLDGFYLTQEQFDSMTYLQIGKKWFFASIIDGLFNLLTLITLITSPFFIAKFYPKKSIWILYFVTIVQLIIMLLTSPQYRYFIHFILFFDFLIISLLVYQKKTIRLLLYSSIMAVSLVLFFPLNFSAITNNQLINKNNSFSSENLIIPHNNSKLETSFETIVDGNLKYNSPLNNSFFWGTGDGELPCVNKDQINYFKKYLNVIPQLRTNDLKDGFYSKKRSSND